MSQEIFKDIPKTIHYCWFGGNPLPKSAMKCIESWRQYFPGYEIKRWDESNFDVNSIPYTRDAYSRKKYAFVSDYARFKILYEEGGLYFDTDVEVIKCFDDILSKGAFLGCEHKAMNGEAPEDIGVNPGLGMAVGPSHPFYKEMLDLYKQLRYINEDGSVSKETVVTLTSRELAKHGLKNTNEIQDVDGILIYPWQYFCPISTEDAKLRISDETHSIHWYDQSWQHPIRKHGRKIILKIGGKKLKTLLKTFLIKQ